MADGRYLNNEGYVRVLRGGKLILEHRHLMEKFLGRALLPHEVVHHKNGNISDNRIRNLEIRSRGDHSRLHASTGRPEVEVVCAECGKTFLRYASKVRYARKIGSSLFCSKACNGRHTVRVFRISLLPRPGRRKPPR